MTREQLANVMDKVFSECKMLRAAGQKEYARREENAMANFERVAERCGISREKALLVYMEKHLDGIHSYVDGHRSQREDVRGRINDAIVYLCILRGMVEEGVAREELALTVEDIGGLYPARIRSGVDGTKIAVPHEKPSMREIYDSKVAGETT